MITAGKLLFFLYRLITTLTPSRVRLLLLGGLRPGDFHQILIQPQKKRSAAFPLAVVLPAVLTYICLLFLTPSDVMTLPSLQSGTFQIVCKLFPGCVGTQVMILLQGRTLKVANDGFKQQRKERGEFVRCSVFLKRSRLLQLL